MSRKPCPYLLGEEMAKKALTRDEVLNQLRKHKPELEKRFGVTTLALFGSTARDEALEDSDIDLMVTFDRTATSKMFFGLQFCVEDMLGRPVDLVTEKAFQGNRRAHANTEAIYV